MHSTQSARYREFLKRLKAARRDAGLTQVAVAKRLGKPQSFISKCETGERRVDVVELDDLARLYRKSISRHGASGPAQSCAAACTRRGVSRRSARGSVPILLPAIDTMTDEPITLT